MVNGRKYSSILALAEAIEDGEVSVDDIQITAFKSGDMSVSLSNRRFTTIVLAGKLPTNVEYREPNSKEEARLKETSVLGDRLPARRIAVTPSLKNPDVMYKVSLDDIGNESALASEQLAAARAQINGHELAVRVG